MAWRPEEPNNKYFKTSVSITNIDLSWLGCALLACDTRGNLYLYKLLPDGGNSLVNMYKRERLFSKTEYHITDSFYRAVIDIKLRLYITRILLSNRIRLVGHTVMFEILDD